MTQSIEKRNELRFYAALSKQDPVSGINVFPHAERWSIDFTGDARPDDCVLSDNDNNVGYSLHRDNVVHLMRVNEKRLVKRAMSEMRNTPDCIVQIMVSKGLKL